MIAKHLPMRSAAKSDFAGLVKYIIDDQLKVERLGNVQVRNCQADTMQAAICEVVATQQFNTRATGDKTFHLLVSFRAGEKIATDTLTLIEQRICDELGYNEHQRVSAVHHDTDNLHVHIAINKIHPAHNTIHDPFQSYKTLSKVCGELEHEFNLERDNHQSKRTIAQGKAADMERHAGVDSLIGWVKRECLDDIKAAVSWSELHKVMEENDLALRVRANGFVIEAGDGTMAKASTVARELSKPKLEARLGAFEPLKKQGENKPKRSYAKSAVGFSVKTDLLYTKYKEEQKKLTTERGIEWEEAVGRKNIEILAAKKGNKFRLSAIKLLNCNPLLKKILYAQAHSAFKDKIKEINHQHTKERQGLYNQYKRRAWADWLKKEALEGNKEALEALRSRESAQGLKGDTIKGEGGQSKDSDEVIDNITKKGTILFQSGKSIVRDDGDKLQVSREATKEAVAEAMKLAMKHYGNRITVNGSAKFKARVILTAVQSNLPITFTNVALERRRLKLLQENNDERRNEHGSNERRTVNRIGDGGSFRRGSRANNSGFAASKHNIGRVGQNPPPQAKNRLRELSELGVVLFTNRIKMLLPRDVSGQLEQQRTQSDNKLRWNRNGVKPTKLRANNSGFAASKHNIGRVGQNPPPQAKNRLRELSELGVVLFTNRIKPLLPRDVSGQLEQQKIQSNNKLRWNRNGLKLTNEQINAAEKYINERETKRKKGLDVPLHLRYTNENLTHIFKGVRNVDGVTLALLAKKSEVFVLPVDAETAQRMKRIKIGYSVTVSKEGVLERSKRRRKSR